MPKTIPAPVHVEEPVRPKTGGTPRPPAQPPGGSDWERRPPGWRGPRERLHRYRMGVAFGLATIAMIFMGLASAFLVSQGNARFDESRNQFVDAWRHIDLPGIMLLNTFLLAVSSFTVELARRRLFVEPEATKEWLGLGRPVAQRTLPWLGITVLLGLGFLAGQAIAWHELYNSGAFYSQNPGSSFFFLFTGLHALHLLGGLLALVWAVLCGFYHSQFERRQIAVDASAWYWHGMGLLWLGIYLLLRFGQ